MKLILIAFAVAVLLGITEGRGFSNARMNNRTPQRLRERVLGDRRIVGGEDADIADHPHMLVLLDLGFGGFICGASAVSRYWSLSAAHCLEFGSPPSNINLRGGSTNRLTGGFLFFAESYFLHPQYDPNWLDFDVAAIRVETETPITGLNVVPIAISPICNTACCQVCEDAASLATIKGWGRNTAGVLDLFRNEVELTFL